MRRATVARRGSNAVEFALVMPVFAVIMAGIVDLAYQGYTQASLESAAHFGCRQGSLLDPGPLEADLPNVIVETEASMVDWFEDHGSSCGAGCTASVAAIGNRPTRSLQCQIGADFEPLVGIVLGSRSLVAEAVVRLEYQRSL